MDSTYSVARTNEVLNLIQIALTVLVILILFKIRRRL